MSKILAITADIGVELLNNVKPSQISPCPDRSVIIKQQNINAKELSF